MPLSKTDPLCAIVPTHACGMNGAPGVAVKGVVIDRVVGGKMTDSRILMDTMGMMQQLGVVPGA